MSAEKEEMSLPSPPPSKKLKQARLPFKVLSPKPIASTQATPSPNQKKRKLSDPNVGPQKAAKTPKNDENSPKLQSKRPADGTENEVSSSSEADYAQKAKSPKDAKPKVLGMLDKFVRTTQQLEVTTSSESDVIDLVSSDNEAEGKEVCLCKTSEENSKASERDQAPKDPHSVEISSEKVSPDNSQVSVSLEKQAAESADRRKSVSSNSSEEDAVNMSVEDEKSVELDERDESKENSDVDRSPTLRDKPPPSSVMQSARTRKSSGAPGLDRSAHKKEAKGKDKQDKALQREKEKTEREKKKQEEKERKEQERLDAKKKKDEERQHQLDLKQKEKDEKLKQKEEERQKKLQEKEEERKKKQDVIEAKNEEKRKKEDEKLKAEEEERAKKDKLKNRFTSFFTKTEKQTFQQKATENKGMFIAFELQKDMRMAPRMRVDNDSLPDRVENVDQYLHKDDVPKHLYLDEIKSASFKLGTASKTWPYVPDIEVTDEQSTTRRMGAKLLKFHENNRPAYYGTWRKTSRVITGRTPFKKEQGVLDYEVDSDDEWEEEEPGESLSDSEKEDDEKEPGGGEDEEDEDGFFVPHGYLSEGEGCEEEDDEQVSPEKLKAQQLAKAKAWDAEIKVTKKCEVLKSICIGCCWFLDDNKSQRDPTWEKLQALAAVPLMATPIPLRLTSASGNTSPSDKAEKRKQKQRALFMPVPDEALPELIRLVHGNIFSFQKLAKEFQEYWRRKSLGLSLVNSEDADDDLSNAKESSESTPENTQPKDKKDEVEFTISKRQLQVKIHSLAVYEKRDGFNIRCWYVNSDVREKHGLTDLVVPTDWYWLTKSNKVAPRSKKQVPVEATTPTQPQNKKEKSSTSTPNITQFTVTGYTPPIVVPSPVVQRKTPKENSIKAALLATPKSTPVLAASSSTPKRVAEKLTPSALFNSPSGAAATDVQHVSDTTPTRESIPKNVSLKDRSQLTVKSMFSPPPSKNITANKPSVQVLEIPPEKVQPGDSAALPMEID